MYTISNTNSSYVGSLQYRISIGDGVHVLGVMEADGDLITRISGVNARLPIGAAGTAVVSNGTLPVYGYPDQLSTASGSAPSYAARAWVNFDGQTAGTNPAPMTIRASGNVSSVTRTATGVFQVNFTTQMSDLNYATTAFTNNVVSSGFAIVPSVENTSLRATTSCVIATSSGSGTGGANLANYTHTNVIIFR